MLGHTMNRIYPLSMLALLAMGLVAGCATSQMSRIDRNRDIYETWPIEVRQAVLDGKVEPGMTPDMVRVAWGEPSEVVAQANTGDEIWVYKKGGNDGSVMYPGGYPSGYPGGGMGGPGIGISTGRGGTVIGSTGGIGIGGGIGMGGTGIGLGGGGMGTPIMTRPTPPDIKEVVFRKGVVHRADNP